MEDDPCMLPSPLCIIFYIWPCFLHVIITFIDIKKLLHLLTFVNPFWHRVWKSCMDGGGAFLQKIFFVWYPYFPPTKLSYEARNRSCRKRWQKQNKIDFINSICLSYIQLGVLLIRQLNHKLELNVFWTEQSIIL